MTRTVFSVVLVALTVEQRSLYFVFLLMSRHSRGVDCHESSVEFFYEYACLWPVHPMDVCVSAGWIRIELVARLNALIFFGTVS